MAAYQLPISGSSNAIAVSDTSTIHVWTLDRSQLETATTLTGALPQYLKISNVGSITAYIAVSNNSSMDAVVPGSSVVGNTIPVFPNTSIDIQLFGQGGPASSVYNNNGSCYIAAITVESTTILVLNAVQPV
jgi:hypothetical protein